MANKFCDLMSVEQPLPVREYATVRVPDGSTFYQGDVVQLGALSTTAGEDMVYECAAIADATAVGTYGIVINQEVEVLSDGRKPDGNPDMSTYSWTAGSILNVKLFTLHDIFGLTEDCIDGTPEVGKYLITQNGDVNLVVAADLTGNTTVALKIEKAFDQPIGYTFEDAFTARVIVA